MSKYKDQKIFSKIFKLILINFSILFILLIILESSIRAAIGIKNCINKSCDFTLIKSIIIKDDFVSKNLEISEIDEVYGYKLSKNFDKIINAHGWDNIRLSTDKDGLRHNEIEVKRDKQTILAVGDSYTLGEEVENSDTWTSCLQSKTKIRVDNAGVFGFGTLQSLLRANFFIEKYQYSTLIFSILVDNDFNRDTYSFRSGFAKPYLKKGNNGITIVKPRDHYRSGTKLNPDKNIFYLISRYSFIYNYLSNHLDFLPNHNYDRLTMKGDQSANVTEIIPWIIDKYSQTKIKNKIILLQYAPNLEDKSVINERNLIKQIIKEYENIFLIDTFQILKDNKEIQEEKLWSPHHTPLGNRLVCEEIYKFFLKNLIEFN